MEHIPYVPQQPGPSDDEFDVTKWETTAPNQAVRDLAEASKRLMDAMVTGRPVWCRVELDLNPPPSATD